MKWIIGGGLNDMWWLIWLKFECLKSNLCVVYCCVDYVSNYCWCCGYLFCFWFVKENVFDGVIDDWNGVVFFVDFGKWCINFNECWVDKEF